MADILVVGSLNMDMTYYVDQFPRIGETKACSRMLTSPGGKGSNQAMAAARLGASVSMFGCVGDDAYGRVLEKNLTDHRIQARLIKILPDANTGTVVITVSHGQNMILLNAVPTP